MPSLRAALMLLVTFCCTGCMSFAWLGYRAPAGDDAFVTIPADRPCMRIGVQNLLNQEQREAVLAAAHEVCAVFSSPQFRSRVEERTWLASCELRNAAPDTIGGARLYEVLAGPLPAFSVHARRPWAAIAQSDPARDRVAIRPSQIAKWKSPDPTVRAALVNTLAHELTHLISTDFQDEGHRSRACEESRLVSYGVGNLTEELWNRSLQSGR